MKKRILSLLLCVAMLLTLLPQTALFASAEISGTCGTNLSWSYNSSTYTLTITGSGAMTNWIYLSDVPWHSYRSSIKSVSQPDGLTSIVKYAFRYGSSQTSVTIPDSVTSIGIRHWHGRMQKVWSPVLAQTEPVICSRSETQQERRSLPS